MIRFHPSPLLHDRWIGIDLNTTGYAVVAADLTSKRVLKLGKKLQYARISSTKNCTKLYKDGKLWKLKKMKTRDKKEFKVALHKIARQIISFAESSGAGIKFEKLFSYRHIFHRETEESYEFSFENGSFITLLHQVEKRALNRGIPVVYVNPANTSKHCSHCGVIGSRIRKRFECPHCGRVIHADVNAAFNIAATPYLADKTEIHATRILKKKMRRPGLAGLVPAMDTKTKGPIPACREIIPQWDKPVVVRGEA